MKPARPNLTFWQLWNLSFGFFGVQIAYSLQSANISRIFATLGADPHSLSFFWILPPLMGMVVQPLVGKFSDRTWCRLGRRIPYLFLGALIAVLVMCMLPNAGSFGLAVGGAMIFGLISLMLLDTSINMAMQPFKMLVGDMVNEEQKAKAYSIQSFLCNAGSLVGYIFPFLFAWIGIANTAPEGQIPDSVKWSFYVGAAILILCVIYTTFKVKEMPPKEYAQFHGIEEQKTDVKSPSMWQLLKHAPSTFWTVGLVQFFCWAAFLYMWTYTNGAIADTVWGTTDAASEGYQTAGNWVGILFAVQAVGSVLWALVIPKFKSIKVAYVVSLLVGAAGFASVFFIHDQYLLFISFLLIGVAWAAMLAIPFTLLTNSLSGDHIGTYLGLFNGTICLPQIVAAACGGLILKLVGGAQVSMFLVAGVFLVLGALAVKLIKTK
ncbi:MAG: SLC45 family MFS transporter [Bacteroidales bacterium]|nr:SLC45 family MFS transporter [Bacteroidales bacterium]MDY6170878.1 SLC45 family MFS transporter [Candidatus Cryptobacteroides sp.]